MRLVAALALVAAASCFSPHEEDGVIACGTGGACPPGFTCGDDDHCYRDPEPTADAAVIDAADIDGTGADANDIDATDIDAGDMPACMDGIDNDCDGLTDYPSDTGCGSALDTDEHYIPGAPGSKACDDGFDNDDDGFTDYTATAGCGDPDPQCSSATDPSE